MGGAAVEVQSSFQAAIFYAPANWGYRFKMAEYYLRRHQDAPDRYVPAALKELAAAVALFPESALLHFRLATTLAWAERYYSGLIPAALRQSQTIHFSEAVRLEPQLQQHLNDLKIK
jgi:hypothetical protein